MANRAPLHVIKKLERALQCAKLENASFGMTEDTVILTGFDGKESPATLDQLIKRETRFYREAWLIPPLEELLAWARGGS